MEGEQIQTLQLNPGTMKPTGSRSLLPRGVYYPARGDVGCSGARGSLPDSTSSTPSRDTTRRLVVVVVVRPTHRHPPHTPRNQTLQKGWAPCKTRSLAAAEQPFPRRSARSGGCTKPGRQRERTGEHGREAGPGRRAAVRGGGEERGEGRAAAARGVRAAPLGLQARTACTPPRAAPRPRPQGPREGEAVQNPRAAPTPSASLTPHRGEGPDREAGRGASRQSLPRCPPPPTPSPLSSSSPPPPPRWSSGPLGSAGQ